MRSVLLLGAALVAMTPAYADTRAYRVGPFTRISNTTPADVRVRVGGAPSVRASGSRAALDRLVVEVRNGELMVNSRPGRWPSGGRTLVEVTAPDLAGATLTGPGGMTIAGVRARDFTARATGPGDLTISGRAVSARLNVTGPGDIHGRTFSLRDADIELLGPGSVTLAASGMVRGRLVGPGNINVVGGARCAIRKLGPGSVNCR